MLMKKMISVVCAAVMAASLFVMPVTADDELEAIICSQSASFTNNGANFVLNTKDTESPQNISWNTTSGEWKGVGVLEFELPAIEGDMIKSAELTYTIHNGSSRSGGRTYNVYGSDIVIDSNATADTLKSIPLSNPIYDGAAVAQGQTRTDTVSGDTITNYVKTKADGENTSKVQFAFSNSSQILDIAPASASLKIVMYGGGIALGEHNITMLTGDEGKQLAVSIFESGIDESSLVWECNSDAVTVSNGLIMPVKAGKAEVTVKTADDAYSDSCTVTVLQSAEGITIDKTEMSLVLGGKDGELTAKATPDNAANRTIIWTSSNNSVAVVSDNGIVTPKGSGSAEITATVKDTELSARCALTVTAAADAESIALSKDTLSLTKFGSTDVLNANVLPVGTDGKITWTSSDETVAKVIDGVVISENPGTATITAATSNGLTANCSVTVNDDDKLITNDRFYTDTDGNILYSQGGGIFKFPGDDTYYWYGVRYKEAVSYAQNPEPKSVEHPAFEAYTCYTSKDLVNWEYKGDVATTQTLGQSWCGWAGRCGVVYNANVKKYVLVSQFNGTIIASADNPLGPFKYEQGYFWGGTALPGIANGDTGDLTMFYDDDGSAYMICSSANGRGHLYVVPMRESDYCDFDTARIKEIGGSTGDYFDEDGTVKPKDKGGIEGDCMFKYNGKYYFTGSDLYGWHGSRVYVFQSDSILGDYHKIRPDYNISAADSSRQLPYIMKNAKRSYAHNSQTGFYYTLHGSKQDTVIYCGDRWSDFCGNGLGYNQWVPLSFEGENDTPVFNDLSQWRLYAETGEWSVGEGNNYLSNPQFDADRVDLNRLTGWECSDNVGGSATGNVKDRIYSGKYSARHSANTDYIAKMKQTVTDLPDGVYTLRASVKSSGGQNECKLYANADGTEYSTSLKSPMNSWTEVVIKNITVTNGECEIGLYSDANAGNYVRIDDMYFTKNTEEGRADVKAQEPVLLDENGNTVTALSAGAEVRAKVNYISDISSNSDKLCLYLALFDNSGTLTDIKTKTETVKQGRNSIETQSLTLPENIDSAYVKVFLWDGSFKPVCESKIIGGR